MKETSDIICPLCNTAMILEDRDYYFKSKYDEYCVCPKCDCGAIKEVNFGKKSKVTYYTEDKGEFKVERFNVSNLDGSEF